jgi:transposase
VSFQGRVSAEVPKGTAALVAKVFQGRPTRPILLREALGEVFADVEFAGWFDAVGRPGTPPGLLMTVCVLQYMEDLSDRAAADAVRSRLDWKYCLGLELEDTGFDFSVLSEFRDRLEADDRADGVFAAMVGRAQVQGLVRKGGRVRTDATHVLAAVRWLNRIELVGESVRAALEQLAAQAPSWLGPRIEAGWDLRYGRKIESGRLPAGEAAQARWAEQTGHDGQALLDGVDAEDPDGPFGHLRELGAVRVLRRVWAEQYEHDRAGQRLLWRSKECLQPASERVNTPHDPDARFSRKRAVEWQGYKLHVSEACEEDLPRLVLGVRTTAATLGDAEVLAEVHADLTERGLAPGLHFVDGGYTGTEQVAQALAQGITVIGPVGLDHSWQVRTEQGYDRDSFRFNWDTRQATCPQGRTSRWWSQTPTMDGKTTVKFAKQDCNACPAKALCTTSRTGRSFTLPPREQHELQTRLRADQHSEDWQQLYNARAGVEGCISRAVRAHGARRTRYRGHERTHVHHVLTACAMNAAIIADWHGRGDTPARQRSRTRFQQLAAENLEKVS